MSNLLKLLLGNITTYATPIVAGVGFLMGVYVSHLYYGNKEASQLKNIQEQITKQLAYDREVVSGYQKREAVILDTFVDMRKKLHEIKVTDVPCNLTSDAVSLWNQSSLAKKDLPSNTTGTSEASSVPPRVEGVGIKIALENKLEEDKILKDCRNQIESIKLWQDRTFGK